MSEPTFHGVPEGADVRVTMTVVGRIGRDSEGWAVWTDEAVVGLDQGEEIEQIEVLRSSLSQVQIDLLESL